MTMAKHKKTKRIKKAQPRSTGIRYDLVTTKDAPHVAVAYVERQECEVTDD